jgi:hypothetical protein
MVSNLKVVINNKEIRKEKSTNFLGVILDSNLTRELHIQKSVTRLVPVYL